MARHRISQSSCHLRALSISRFRQALLLGGDGTVRSTYIRIRGNDHVTYNHFVGRVYRDLRVLVMGMLVKKMSLKDSSRYLTVKETGEADEADEAATSAEYGPIITD